jgi:hypothetical protein
LELQHLVLMTCNVAQQANVSTASCVTSEHARAVVRAMAQLDLIKWSHVLIQGQRNLDGSEAQGSRASANSSLPLSSHLVHALLAKIGRSLAGALPSTRIQDTSEACDGAFYLDASASCASCAVHARPTVKYVDKNAQLEACILLQQEDIAVVSCRSSSCISPAQCLRVHSAAQQQTHKTCSELITYTH